MPSNPFRSTNSRRLGVVTIIATTAALSSTVSAVPAGAAPAGPVVASGPCTRLVPGAQCSFTYGDHPNGFTVSIAPGVANVTAIVSGATGGQADHTGPGGAGTATIGSLAIKASERSLSIWLGQPGRYAGADGWSRGGTGGAAGGRDGSGGGGASAIAWTAGGHDHPLIVSGGGGGGGGSADLGVLSGEGGGGAGGVGGDSAGAGQKGQAPGASGNGRGGDGDDAKHADGGAGESTAGEFGATSGGGGGGGGYKQGGAGGLGGTTSACNTKGKCPPGDIPAAGGGGGAGGSYASSDVHGAIRVAAPRGAGRVTLIDGTPQRFDCADSWNGRVINVPSGVKRYEFVAVGGAGSRLHDTPLHEGSGAVVSGALDVTGVNSLGYWVGCSAYHHGGAGFGRPGHGGSASLMTGKNGGDGGGASMIEIRRSGSAAYVPAIAAGGGGGAGGDSCGNNGCTYFGNGGKGGSAGGTDGTQYPFHGQDGSGLDGRGGCSACTGDRNGNDSRTGGAGGGGGSGYPRGGHGGDSGLGYQSGGGGGGAGESYVLTGATTNVATSTSGDGKNGFILLIAER